MDGRNYDFAGISKVADQLLITDWEQRSQSFDDECLAGPNSNFYYTIGGILAYQDLGLHMNKLLLGVPYYAHDYQCIKYSENMRCYIKQENYRGVNCTSNVAKIVPYNRMHEYVDLGNQFWDEHSSTLVYNYVVRIFRSYVHIS